MKFLCVPCDRPMKLQAVAPPDRGSLSVVYSCPDCGYEMAMLTNPYETQIVQSLGVRVGPEESAADPSGRAPARGAGNTSEAGQALAAGGTHSGGSEVSRGGHSGDNETAVGAHSDGPKCPFAALIPAMEGAIEGSGHAAAVGAGATEWSASPPGEPQRGAESQSGAGETAPVRWTSAAEARLANIPAFVRPMARTGIEKFAREKGCLEVDEKILDAARDFFGM